MNRLERGSEILKGRYRLVRGPLPSSPGSELWVGVDPYDEPHLLKLWLFQGAAPDDLARALFDRELRTLYRVGSSPGADETLVVLKDAAVDREAHCFVMASVAPGMETLDSQFARRTQFPWLCNRDTSSRRELWTGLQRVAEALRLLHDQRVLHRNVGASSVFLDTGQGVSTFRLGGFEWSVRLGVPATEAPPMDWSSPPEFFAGGPHGYAPETDWYGFGALAARCILSLENYAAFGPRERHDIVQRDIENARDLTDVERAFLLSILAQDPKQRLARGYEVIATIKNIIARLDVPSSREQDGPLVVVVDPKSSKLIEACEDVGFMPEPGKATTVFNPNDLMHVARLKEFIQDDMVSPQLCAQAGTNLFALVGSRIVLLLGPFKSTDQAGDLVESWDHAFCVMPGELRGNEAHTELPKGMMLVRTPTEVRKDRSLRQRAQPWNRHLPRLDRSAGLRAHLQRFHDFIRCTNQIELLIRDAEIFAYDVVERRDAEGVERIKVRAIERQRQAMPMFRVDGGMVDFLQREVDSNKPDCRLVGLTSEDEDTLLIERVPRESFWQVEHLDDEHGVATLVRSTMPKRQAPAANRGCLRTFGMFGQIALIRRRQRAIERLQSHAYLLRSLSAAGQVYMDTGVSELAFPLPPDRVDTAKRSAIEDVLRVRPIYALQGPPGTGKTTLVAHLIRQILTDDPVAQILITAQAHGAVDVLRAKVRDEAFHGVDESLQPLSVRLGGDRDGSADDGSVENVALRLLAACRGQLESEPQLNSLRREWLANVAQMVQALQTRTADAGAADFCQLVKRGANVTYCTTSAGDLETLADMTQFFDWAIVEEAGKAHGFDLALPLQAGHRWLLIGDHKQLPPYRLEEYRKGIDDLDACASYLQSMPDRRGGLVDIEWIRSWQGRPEEARATFKEYAREWLKTFEQVFNGCRRAPGEDRLTIDEPRGAAAGMLSGQHRMHPTIGDLISVAYYDRQLVNRTSSPDGRPLARVTHPYSRPDGVADRAIVWLDIPWASREPRSAERGPNSGYARYSNPAEVQAVHWFLRELEMNAPHDDELELAVLSPYNQQVAAINRHLRSAKLLPNRFRLKQERRRQASEAEVRYAHTVDSFQGDQADVILVSLVRNNELPAGDGLGFLSEASRINVLLSRAERLLVLVGSWDFLEHQVSLVRLEDRTETLWHWKQVASTLSTWFQEGRAIRLTPQVDWTVAL